MAYELRIDGRKMAIYDKPESALERVRACLRVNPDAEIEVMDTRTGRAFETCASKRWRDEIASRLG